MNTTTVASQYTKTKQHATKKKMTTSIEVDINIIIPNIIDTVILDKLKSKKLNTIFNWRNNELCFKLDATVIEHVKKNTIFIFKAKLDKIDASLFESIYDESNLYKNCAIFSKYRLVEFLKNELNDICQHKHNIINTTHIMSQVSYIKVGDKLIYANSCN